MSLTQRLVLAVLGAALFAEASPPIRVRFRSNACGTSSGGQTIGRVIGVLGLNCYLCPRTLVLPICLDRTEL
jgi:hypothetical protein